MPVFLAEESEVVNAQAVAESFAGGSGMFTTPCYTDGVLTHYISAGEVSAELLSALIDSTSVMVHEESVSDVLLIYGLTLTPPEEGNEPSEH